MTVDSTPVLELHGVSKTFGGARALDDVSLEVQREEVHGLLGENGSGKSTLIKILAGFHDPDPGAQLRVNGASVELPLAPGQFRSLGMAFVHQDLGLVPSLSVVENLRVRILAPGGQRRISWRRERRRARELFRELDVEIDPYAKVADLAPTDRALLAIVRAIDDIRTSRASEESGLLVLDETTVFLPESGRQRLFALIDQIKRELASVLFVSHDLEEAVAATDRITVLRDGRRRGTVRTDQVTHTDLVELIIGRSLQTEPMTRRAPVARDTEADVEITQLSGPLVDGVGLELHQGEVLGISGVAGSGYDEIPYLLFGAVPAHHGSLRMGGRRLELTSMTPARAVQERIALIPADRLQNGSVATLPVVDNMMLQVLDQYSPWRLQRRRMEVDAREALTLFEVRPRDPEMTYENLSGGNQQKVLLAKWLQAKPRLVLLHEPTQGVDIGAREKIFSLIRQMATDGAAVLIASNDAEQLVAVCQRVVIFARGHAVRELRGTEVTKERLSEQTYVLAETVGQAADGRSR